MTLQIIITIYFLINAFFAGYVYCDESKFNSKVVLFAIVGAFILIYGIVLTAIDALEPTFQFKFFFDFLFTKKWHNVDKERLALLNSYAKKKTTWWPSHLTYRLCMWMINKRNNYTPSK